MTRSVLFWVQYLLGIGHLQRVLRIADALVDEGVAVSIVSGGKPAPLPRRPGIRFVQLPPVHAADARFQLIGGTGAPIDETLREQRRAMLLAVCAEVRPDVVALEAFPFGRRAFRFELDPLLAAVRAAAPRPRVVCLVRDIVVVRDDPERHREIVDRVRRDFDAVLVHGDPALVPFGASFPAAEDIADRLFHTGYVAPPAAAAAAGGASDGGQVIVSAGGGAAGGGLLRTALAARDAGCMADRPWLLLSGPNLPEPEAAALRRAAKPGVAVERFRPDLSALLRRCSVSISQAGYNTVLDILAARARAVLVPFAAERETEQLLRAERLAALGAAELVRETELTPQRLAAAIERAAARPPPTLSFDMDGAARSARLIARLSENGEGFRPANRPSIMDQ